ncbi:MAG: ankyrin repeat domain-containing protein [Lachnospiraceae bacterium]|nr:ankyrin repeat domain-containing protein [Lachnospiraceae bacterium]
MDSKEIITKLLDSAESSSGKFIPWWADESNKSNDNQIFTPEEIREVEEYVKACDADTLSAINSNSGYSLFHLLVWLNFYDAVKMALEKGVPADLVDGKERGVIPLLFTCCRGNYAMAKLLSEYGADLSHCDAKGRNGFHYLAHPFADGFKFSEEPIHSLNQRKEIALLLAGNTKSQASDTSKTPLQVSFADINQKDAQGIMPLVYLVDGGLPMISATLIDTYLALGADPYFVDDMGNTLLFRALMRRRTTAALRLMEYPQLVAQETKSGKTVLMAAEENHSEGLCVALKDHGAKGECELAEVDTINLARLANNAFVDAFGCHHQTDQLALGIYLTKKLIKLAEEEEDYGCIEHILETPLEYGKTIVLDMLHEAGADFTEPYYNGVDSVNCLRDKCLEYSCDTTVIKKLIEFGVDMEKAVISGQNVACTITKNSSCRADVIRLFSAQALMERDNSGRAAIHYAINQDDETILAAMIEQGVDVNLTQDAPATAGNTPLHLACIYGNIKAAELLMKSGADDTICNAAGYSAAHYILLRNTQRSELSSEDRLGLFSLLTHIDLADNSGKTPLMYLFSWEIARMYLEMEPLLEILLKKGADVNHVDDEGNTPLLLCADNFGGHLQLFKALCEAGADINAIDTYGNNVLYYVFKSGSQSVAKYLLKRGADYKHANNSGVTPQQVAAEKGFDTLFTYMEDI